ncbi:Ies3p SKDI_12G1050 [Saccharomyces kudriavzevii IFO 1802]|uniref:IES3-like protein n=2 Tax=Saccharomyces kudriavzevii (strain ATCC MYA-4449 / AS 2.2408 / CBS 8840 / NBRC 1802 / NCYC 2889) TaxID=226230 RepID=J6EMZ2_SACK1|nr:uncharacterized protein SKDI_12G1050 [Saccharomyces kudriavzevii IFO 1802]EJT44337.1 IES3-like protein [Saccharomyces kudriavzevii IFO 1802]CAI4045853.1 hypothetical protein SKDI_12G1050 [Saccharomyces kudriavzevii IFO 1802]
MKFEELLATDKQVQFAHAATQHYKSIKTPDFLEKDPHHKKFHNTEVLNPQGSSAPSTAADANPTSTFSSHTNNSTFKRHIVAVDDISKMNYEMIKNSPGNVVTNANQDEIDISTLKTRLYKDNLYTMNDKFLQAVNDQIVILNEAEQGQETEDIGLPDGEKIDILTKIQESLLEEYETLSQKERKWFILKELLLDANVELDLFSNRGRKADHPIAFGAVAIPTNVNANSLAFNRTKRRKISKNGLSENIL